MNDPQQGGKKPGDPTTTPEEIDRERRPETGTPDESTSRSRTPSGKPRNDDPSEAPESGDRKTSGNA